MRDREEWLGVQERLIDRDVSPWYRDFVLGARTAVAAEQGTPVDPELSPRCVEVTLRTRFVETGGPDTPHRPGDDPELDQFVTALRDLVGKILRHEARFRADGLLPPDGHVATVAARDLGRASKMARWAHRALTTDPDSPWRTVPFRGD